MSIVVNYPEKICNYSIIVSNTEATIRLFGLETNSHERFIGAIHFLEKNSFDNAFINRGGFLNVSYPLVLLPSILLLLNRETPLFVEASGQFTTTNNKHTV